MTFLTAVEVGLMVAVEALAVLAIVGIVLVLTGTAPPMVLGTWNW